MWIIQDGKSPVRSDAYFSVWRPALTLHLVCFSGVFIESPAEAAMRELKEETGIKLKLSDVSSSPHVDMPQTDNLNPHKGRRSCQRTSQLLS